MRWALAIIPIFEYGSLVRTSDFKWRLPWIGRAIMLHGWLESAATFQFVVDAMPIQALDRKDLVLTLSPVRAKRHGFEYFRHGTLSESSSALHPDVLILAQPGGVVVREDRARCDCSRRVHFGLRLKAKAHALHPPVRQIAAYGEMEICRKPRICLAQAHCEFFVTGVAAVVRSGAQGRQPLIDDIGRRSFAEARNWGQSFEIDQVGYPLRPDAGKHAGNVGSPAVADQPDRLCGAVAPIVRCAPRTIPTEVVACPQS